MMPIPITEIKILDLEDSRVIARFFQILADPTRLRLLKVLREGTWCVSDLAQALEMDQPAISHQLKYLRSAEIVSWEKHGRHVYYTLDHPLLNTILGLVLDTMINNDT